MPSISNLSFSVNYNLVGTPTLVLTDTTSSAPTGMVGYFTVTMPDGYTTNTSEINAGGSASVVLRLDSSGEVQCGNYTIVFEATAPGYFGTEFTRTFNFSYAAPTLVLKNLFDPFVPSLAYRDDTVYTIGSYTQGAITRAWEAVSTPTGTLTGNTTTFDMSYNGDYYAANYTITLDSSVTYTHNTYAWLTVSEGLSKTETACVSSPKTIAELIEKINEVQQDETCSTNHDFEQVQTLFTHFVDLLKLELMGNINQEETYPVYEQLVTLLFNESGCNPDNGILQPYDISAFNDSHLYTVSASYSELIGDGNAQSFTIIHNLDTDRALVQVYDVNGSLVECDITILSNNSLEVSFDTVPTNDQYKVVVHSGADHLEGPQGEPGQTIVSDTPPANPYEGLQWFNSSTGATYIYYDNTWVQDANSNVVIVDGGVGTVTNVAMTTPTGLTVTGSPITNAGTLALSYSSGYAIPTTLKQSNWDDAYTFVGAFPSQTGNTGKYLSTDGSVLSWATLDLTAYVPTTRTLTINGTAYDLSANRSWTVGTVTNVSALTIGTTGTDISSSVATGTTTPVITLNIPTASATNRGVLSSADWTTFNNKQNALTNPITGTGASGQIAYWSGTNTQTGSATFTFTPTSQLLINNSVTASGAIARGQLINTTLVAAANNDFLIGLDINPTFTNGAFTNVSNLALRTTGNVVFQGSTSGYGNLSNITVTALQGLASSNRITSALVANANNDALVALDINPTFTTGSFTGVNNIALRVATLNNISRFGNLTTGGTANGGLNGVTITTRTSGHGLITAYNYDLADPIITDISTGASYGLNGSPTNFYGIGLSAARSTKYDIWFQTGNSNGGGYRFYKGLTEMFTIFQNGNVGINTGSTDSGDRLQVNGNSLLTGSSSSTGNALTVRNSTPTTLFSVQNAGGVSVTNGQTTLTHTSTQLRISDGTYKWDIRAVASTSNNDLRFTDNDGNLVMTLFNGANVSIGNTSNNAKLSVTGTSILGGFCTISGSVSSTTTARGALVSSTLVAADNNMTLVGLDISPTFNTGPYTGVTNYALRTVSGNIYLASSSGNVGIGVVPTTKLDVNGNSQITGSSSSTGNALTVRNSTPTTLFSVANSGGATLSLNQNASTNITISNTTSDTASLAAAVFTSTAGSLSIGKLSSATTTYKIRVANDGYIYNGTVGDIAILNDVASGKIKFAAGGSSTAQMILDNTGKLGINTITPFGYAEIVSESSSPTAAYYSTQYISDAINVGGLVIRRARGTQSSPTAILSGDAIGGIFNSGYHSGGAFGNNIIAIRFLATENFTSTAQGSKIEFATTSNGATTRTVRLTIENNGDLTYFDGGNFVIGTTTGTKIGTSTSQKISLWNATPDVQPTTAITAAAFTANTSGIVDDTATFGGYTIGQVVAALKRIGALA